MMGRRYYGRAAKTLTLASYEVREHLAGFAVFFRHAAEPLSIHRTESEAQAAVERYRAADTGRQAR